MNYMKTTEYTICPNCESNNINKIVYGLVHDMVKPNPDDKLKMFPEQQSQEPVKKTESTEKIIGKSTELGGCVVNYTEHEKENRKKIGPDWHCRDCDFKWPHTDLKKKTSRTN